MLVGLLTVAIKSWGGGGGAVDMYWGFAAAEKEKKIKGEKLSFTDLLLILCCGLRIRLYVLHCFCSK